MTEQNLLKRVNNIMKCKRNYTVNGKEMTA